MAKLVKNSQFLPLPSLLFLMVIGYLLVCFAFIAKYDFWRDEAFSVNVANKSIPEIVGIVSHDVHPPLHIILLKGWMAVFGDSETGVRSLSVVFGVLAIILSFELARTIFPEKKYHYWLVALLITSPNFLFYSIEARAYTMLMASIVGVILFFLQAKNSSSRWIDVAFIISTLFGLYGHVIFIPAMIGVVVWQLLVLGFEWWSQPKSRKKVRQLVLRFFINYSIIGLLFSPWLFALFQQLTQVNEQGFWLTFNPVGDLVSSVQQIFTSATAAGHLHPTAPLIIFLVGIGGVCLTLLSFGSHKNPYQVSWLALLCLAPIYVISFNTPIYYIRYLTFIVPLAELAVLIGLRTLDGVVFKRGITVAFALFCALQLYLFAGNTMQLPYTKEDTTSTLNSIAEQYPEATIVHPHGFTLHNFIYYAPKVGLEPGKVHDPQRRLPHFEGTAAFTDADYTTEPLDSYDLVVTPYYYQDQGFEDQMKAAGYQEVGYHSFDGGLFYKAWEKW